MNNKNDGYDGKYKRAEQHYKDRTSIYEDREKKILKQPVNNNGGRQRRFNIMFVLPVILLVIVIYPKLSQYYEKFKSGAELAPISDIISYIEYSKSAEESAASVMRAYSQGEGMDIEAVREQYRIVEEISEALNTNPPPNGFEEYNAFQLEVLKTDMEILNLIQGERSDEAEYYFNVAVEKRNYAASARKEAMKAALDARGIKYADNEYGGIDIEYFYKK